MSEDSTYKLCYNCAVIVLDKSCPICNRPLEDWPNNFIDTGKDSSGNSICRNQKLSNNR